MTYAHRLLLAVLVALLPGTVLAQSTTVGSAARVDQEQPVEVEADRMDLDQTQGIALLTGDVIVTQGDMRIAAPKIEVFYTRLPDGSVGNEIDYVHASGGVVMVTPEEDAQSQEAVYRPGLSEVVMTGDVVLNQGPNTMSGDQLVVDLDTGDAVMEGRVRSLLTPGTVQ